MPLLVHAVLQAASRKSRENHATCLFMFTRTKARRIATVTKRLFVAAIFLFRITDEHVLHLLLNLLQGIPGGLNTPVTLLM